MPVINHQSISVGEDGLIVLTCRCCGKTEKIMASNEADAYKRIDMRKWSFYVAPAGSEWQCKQCDLQDRIPYVVEWEKDFDPKHPVF